MRRLLLGVLVAATWLVGLSAQGRAVPPLHRIVEKPLVIHAPPPRCGGEAPLVVLKLGEAAGVLTGAERLPGRCAPGEPRESEPIPLQGLTVEAALARIVEVDPRFAWRDRNGVIVLRPVEAWTVADNPLNLEVQPIAARERNYAGALDLFLTLVTGAPARPQPESADQGEPQRRTFDLATPKGPAIDALDAIVRAHGALGWLVSYKRRPASGESLYVQAFSFNGVGTLVQRRGDDPPAQEEVVDDPLQRIVDNDFEVQTPLTVCSVPETVAKLAKRHEVPAGVEFLPEACPPSAPRGATVTAVKLGGLTVAAALDKLAALDPRFRWIESDGLALMRPVRAWGDDKNVLNFTSASFAVQDVNLDVAMSAVVSALQERPRDAVGEGVRTNQGNRLFSVKTGPTSVGGALDAIVRAHGESWWELRHFTGSPNVRMLGFQTFDGSYIRALIPNPTR